MKRYLAALLCFALLVTSMATPIDFVTIRAAAMESGMSESDNSQDSNETVDTNLETPPDTTNKDLNTPEDDEKEPAAPPEGEEGEKDPITPPEGGEGETDPTTPPEGGEGETDPTTPPEGGENETDPATPPEGEEGETDPITPPEGDPNAPATGENVPAPNLPVEGEAGEDKPKSSLQMKIEADRANESTYKAKKTLRPIDVNEPITEAVWGTPSVTINQSNASLYKHNAQDKDIEDVSADLYFRWDSDYLYFGVVSSDSDIRETNGYWEGDGIQFHLEAGNTISNGGFSDFCLTMGPEEYINDKGETKFGQFGVGGNSNNQEALTQNVKKKIIAQNGVIYMMMAIPHNDMGALAEAGEQYAINLLRIIGDQYHEYHGWLDWGGYFDDKGYDSGSAYVIELSDEAPIQDEEPIKANKTARAIDVNTPITEAVWGTPSITINKNNASLYRHNAQDKEMEEVSADLYFRWDKDYLYFGVVSSDGDIRETNGYWEGDGIQFHLEAGDTISNGGFSDFCLTMGPEEYVNDKGETKFGQFGVGGNSNNQEALTQNVKKKIIAQNGVIYMMMAIPHNDMGALAEAGEQYAINLLRIIGDQYHEYHGWLDWGGYFDDKGYDSGSAYVIELSDESPVQDEEPIKANKTNKAIDVTKPITEAVWGTPSVTINKDNASLYKHNAQDKEMEEVSADLYFRWDKDYLYFGVVSSDSDIRETNGYWEGDGIQFHLEAGDTISNGGFSDFCLTMGPEEYVNDKGETKFGQFGVGGNSSNQAALEEYVNDKGETKFGQFGVGGNSSNQAALTKNVKKKIIAENGVIYMMMAIPHADMGANPVAGEQYAINLLRIIGDQFHEYHGWLDWGGYFTDKGYDSGSASVVVLDSEILPVGNYLAAEKVDTAIDVTIPITEAVWGTPTITINKDNASLYKHNAQEKEMEEVSADLYFRWDKDYLYFGVVSSDSDIRETNSYWEGDGIQFHLEAGNTISNGGFSDFCLTMGPEEYVNDKGETKFGQFGVGGNSSNQAALTKNVKKKIIAENGVIYMMMAIPHTDMGANPVAGEQYAINLLRIIGDQFHEYHGWLDWGGYFTDKGYDSTPSKVIVLYEKGSGGSSGEVVTGSLFDITGAVGGTADKEGFNDTLKLAKVGDDIYTAYMTGSNTFTSSSGYKALNEISMYKVSGKTVTDLGRLYTRAGDVDVLATGGSVYVVGGSSNFVIKETSSKGTAGTEKAVLNVWTCSNGKEIANGHTTQKSFPSTKNKYNYLTSSVSPDGKFIYAFYLADTSLAWFTFDISSNKWIGDAKTQELSGTAEKAYVFNKNNSLSFVYVSGGKVFETAVTASASSREILSGVTEVKDIYLTSDGKLCVLYSSADGVSISIDGTASPIKSMASTDYGRLSQNSKGEVNILAMEKDKPATAKVLSANGSNVKSITLDSKNAASSVPVIAAPRGGTPLTGKVQMMFPARYRATNHWYYAEIALD